MSLPCADLHRRPLNHDWEFALEAWCTPDAKLSCSTLEWLPARVPGQVHTDLIENGVIADPFELKHELGCQWVDDQAVRYRLRFDFTPDASRPRRVLRFNGLDTLCRVHLNGQFVGESRNMFVPLEIDVGPGLMPGENLLELQFESAVRVGRQLRAAYFLEHGIAQGTNRFDERSFVRKAQYMYGWDWGPRLVSVGVWQPVELLEYSARIHHVHVTQTHEPDGTIRVHARTEADAGVAVHWLAPTDALASDGEIAHLATPARWYPNGLGPQPLYELSTYLCPAGFSPSALPVDRAQAHAVLERVAFDVRVTKIGLRTVRLIREPDEHGESFEFEVNGQRLFALGANWIPDHSFPARVTREALRARLESARAVGMNMLRVWGGGLYESDDFYELCDELGLLVWQDFPFACGYYPDTGPYPEELRVEASVNVRRLRHHASLALWCGNNENLTMWQNAWGGKDVQPARYYGERLFEQLLPEVLRELDPERPYIASSPDGGDDANGGGYGDQHYWDVWHGRGDWKFYPDSTARFSSEYGFASACSLLAWRAVFGQRETAEAIARKPVRDAIVRWHDKTAKGYDVFLAYVGLHYPEVESLSDWVYFSQLNQRDAIRCAIEHYRRSAFCRGSLIWQLNDCWPVQSWSLIDGVGQPKLAYFELRRLHAARLLSITLKDGAAVLHASLDNAQEPWRAKVSLSAFSLEDGRELCSCIGQLALCDGERQVALSLALASLDPKRTLLVARAEHVECHALLVEPKELALAAPTPLVFKLGPDDCLEIATTTPLVDLVVTDEASSSAFLDNCITVAQPGRVRLRYRGSARALSARSLAGEHPLIAAHE